MNNWQKKIVLVFALELLLWVGYFSCKSILETKYPDQFYVMYPMVMWLNVLAIGCVVLFIVLHWRWEKKQKTWNPKTLSLFLELNKSKRAFAKILWFRLSLFFLLVALSQPLFGVQKVKTKLRNAEIMLVIDVSNSMNTCDIDKNNSRLQIAKRGINEFINACKGERVGIVLFAENAFVQLPLTKDYAAAKLFVNEIETKMMSNQGTNFKLALETANRSFTKEKNQKAVLLLTDGENHTEIPIDDLEKMQKNKTFLSIIGIGTKEGGKVPYDIERPELGYMTNDQGQLILSKVDYGLIRTMAKKANGYAVFVQTPFPNLSELLTQINRLSEGKVRDLLLEIKSSQYHYPLLLGLVCWLLSNDLFFGRNRKKQIT